MDNKSRQNRPSSDPDDSAGPAQPQDQLADADSQNPETAALDSAALDNATPGGAAERPAKKPVMPPSRIAFLIFVAVSLVVIGVELRARWTYSDTVQELDQAWDAAQAKGVGIYRADVEKLVHGSPSRVYDEQQRTETLRWRGVFVYGLETRYDRGDFLATYKTLKRGK